MRRRLLTSVLLVVAVGIVAVTVAPRSSGPDDDVAAADGASVLADRSGLPDVASVARPGTTDRLRAAANLVRVPALPANTALVLAAALAGFLVLAAAAPHPSVCRAALVPLRAPPARRAD